MDRTTDKALAGVLAGVVLVSALIASPRAARGQAVTSEQVNAAVQRGLARLRQQQTGSGHWSGGGHPGGVTALALLAMLNSGLPPNDPTIVKGLAALVKIKDSKTYVVSLKCQVFAATKLDQYRPHLEASAKWLVNAQSPTGMWGYGHRNGGDNSNTQFALLGLHEAAKAGVEIPNQTWALSRKHYENTQGADGGWGYRGRTRSHGSMTAAGIASLYICGSKLHVAAKKEFIDGSYPGCGHYKQNDALAKGLEWMRRNFTVRENPGRGNTWLHYYLYGLERVGMISGKRNFGTHDWYREGAAMLVATERAGTWGQTHQSAFSLLFLTKGNRPVLFQKLQWDKKNPAQTTWHRNIHDLENLTAAIGKKLGKEVTWQTTTLEMSLEDLRQSPVLFITGHEFPNFTQEEKDKLKQFAETGGTLLFEACCGKAEFTAGFRRFAREVWKEYPAQRLAKDHPVFHSYYDYPDSLKSTYNLEGVDVGCRTSVLFSPGALSCLWELRDIPTYSRLAFRLGTNIAAYATGREKLGNKLDKVDLPKDGKIDQPRETPRGAVRIARLFHNGDYHADAKAMPTLAALLRDKAKVDVVARGRVLRADDKRLYQYPVVFMTGHFDFTLSNGEIDGLRLYLKRGGMLLAEACCGKRQFDAAFRRMCKKLFPDSPLKALPDDHPIYAGKVGVPLGELKYRRILAEELKKAGVKAWHGTTRPPLEQVLLDGRAAILYSKYDYSCALEGDKPYSCRGYVDSDGKKLALDLFLYAISY